VKLPAVGDAELDADMDAQLREIYLRRDTDADIDLQLKQISTEKELMNGELLEMHHQQASQVPPMFSGPSWASSEPHGTLFTRTACSLSYPLF